MGKHIHHAKFSFTTIFMAVFAMLLVPSFVAPIITNKFVLSVGALVISLILSTLLYQLLHNFLAFTYRAKPQAHEAALVTGGTSGIGLEISKLFVRDGFPTVVLVSNDSTEKIQDASSLLSKMNPTTKIIAVQKDLARPEAPQEVFDQLKEQGIVITHLVNNAGWGAVGKFIHLPMKKQLDMMAVNIGALSHLAHLFAAEMIAKKVKGRILNVASVASFQPGPGWIVYSASKAYVRSFSVGLAEELKEYGIQVCTLCPGATRTPFMQKAGHLDTPLATYFPHTTPEYVAIHAYYGMMQNHLLVTPGFLNKLLWWLSPLLPQDLLLNIVVYINKTSMSPTACSNH